MRSATPVVGLFFESEATYPLLMSLTETFLTLKPVYRDSLWETRSASPDLTSVVSMLGAKATTIQGFMIPVSNLPTGTVPIPPILYTS